VVVCQLSLQRTGDMYTAYSASGRPAETDLLKHTLEQGNAGVMTPTLHELGGPKDVSLVCVASRVEHDRACRGCRGARC
jgi:hypothetical protein